MSYLEEFDKNKTKVLKYIIYKRRTENEVRTKFKNDIEENMLEDIIEYLKEAKYIDDDEYIERTINNFKILKALSLKELQYKLIAKGLSRNLLEDYFSSDAPAEKGMPSVQYCADKLCLSANYFSDLCRKETGMSALKHIQQKMFDVAKERVFNVSKSISEISYELGFPYPQHFSRWFKKMAGNTPNEYRQNTLN